MFDYRENLIRNVNRIMFDFDPVQRVELQSFEVEDEGKRYYWVPDPRHNEEMLIYPSVTTVIAEKSDRTYLDRWKDNIGHERANQVLVSAQHRGTSIHDMAEAYLYGEAYWRGQGTVNILDFNRLVPILNKSVTNIYGIELPLYSHRLRTAGRADLLCKWDGDNCIADFKTSRKEKLEQYIQHYFIQATTYAMMAQEIYNLDIPKICVIILIDHEKTPTVFLKDKAEFIPKVEEYFLWERHSLATSTASTVSTKPLSRTVKTLSK